MSYYFYCPKCNFSEKVKKLPLHTIPNCRDGYGISIHHFKCPNCNNFNSGFMQERTGSLDEKEYYKYIISLYQNN